MRKYLLSEGGKFYKANLHCHTNISDGQLTPAQVKEHYMEHGYSIVAYTDHDIMLGHSDLNDENFLALTGFELEFGPPPEERTIYGWKACHICYIALEADNLTMPMWERSGRYLFCQNQKDNAPFVKFDESEPDYIRRYSVEGISEAMRIGREKGFFVTYNHPVWSGETFEEYGHYEGMNAMEICNYGCYFGGLPEYNAKVYDDILRTGKRIYCIGTDDNHSPYDTFGAFTMIKADKLEYREITKALEAGNFYASMGPEIHDLYVEDGYVYITCSPAKKISFNTGYYRGYKSGVSYAKDGEYLTEAKFKVDPNCVYFRLTVTDEHGLHANTNAYFCDEVFDS